MMLALVAARHPALHAKILSSLRSAEQLKHALPVEWLPIEVDIEVMEAVAHGLSWLEVESLVEDRQREEMGSALFKTFVLSVGKIFGLTPAQLVRHLGKGWRQVMQDCGTIEIETVEANAATAWLRDLPAACLASPSWTNAIAPGIRMLYELVGTRGTVTSQVRGRDIELRFRW